MFGDMSTMEVFKLILPYLLIEFGLKVFAIYRLSKDRAKWLPKVAWVFIILFVNLFGPIIFLVWGRESY